MGPQARGGHPTSVAAHVPAAATIDERLHLVGRRRGGRCTAHTPTRLPVPRPRPTGSLVSDSPHHPVHSHLKSIFLAEEKRRARAAREAKRQRVKAAASSYSSAKPASEDARAAGRNEASSAVRGPSTPPSGFITIGEVEAGVGPLGSAVYSGVRGPSVAGSDFVRTMQHVFPQLTAKQIQASWVGQRRCACVLVCVRVLACACSCVRACSMNNQRTSRLTPFSSPPPSPRRSTASPERLHCTRRAGYGRGRSGAAVSGARGDGQGRDWFPRALASRAEGRGWRGPW